MAFGKKRKRSQQAGQVPQRGKAQPGETHAESQELAQGARSKGAEGDPDAGGALNLCRAFLRHRKLVVAAFFALAVICALCIPQVKVNYDLTAYLPDDTASTVALNDMQEAFDSGIPNLRVLAEGISQAQAEQLSKDLANIDGVSEVMWLGTAVDTAEPLAVQDEDTVSSWVTEGGDGYLFQLTVDGENGQEVLAQVRSTAEGAGAAVYFDGTEADSVDLQESAAVQIVYIMIIAVAIIIAILLLTSHSWLEPLIFLVVIGVAIVMNMGTNLFIGEISFVSQICGAILQLAVSMDYAIVFLHTFRRAQREYSDAFEAMAHAMKRGFSVVLSSAAVTFFGFLALSVMDFKIGVDMGVVLAKGIACSFLTVMFFMPCLTLMLLKPLNALNHRYIIPSLDKFARGCQKIMVPAAIVVIVVAVPSFLAADSTDFIYGTIPPDSESQLGKEEAYVEECFESEETWVLMVPEGQLPREQELADTIEAMDHVTGVTSYVTVAGRAMPVEAVPESSLSQLMSNGWSRMVITSDSSYESDEAFALVEQVRNAAHELYGDDYRLAGTAVSTYDLRDTVQADSIRVQVFTIVAIGIVLAVMFRSLSIPIVMLLAIKLAVWMNQAVPYFTGEQLSYIAYMVIDSVQMGASVDYAIIYAREYFDRRKQYGPGEAARSAVKHGGVPIMTSASILILAGVAIGLVSTITIISQLGSLIWRGALLSMLMMFVFLPWLFKTCDGLIRKTSMGLHGLSKS